MDWLFGALVITTFRKLPIIVPKIKYNILHIRHCITKMEYWQICCNNYDTYNPPNQNSLSFKKKNGSIIILVFFEFFDVHFCLNIEIMQPSQQPF